MMRRAARLAAAIAVSLAIVSPVTAVETDQAPLINDDYVCTHPSYNIHLLSKSPLVIYISDFITPSERKHLLELAAPTFSRSAVLDHSSGGSSQNTHRTSQSTSVSRLDPVVRCVQARALLFQGLNPSSPSVRALLEPLQLVKYGPGEHFHYHTDWFTDPSGTGGATARAGNRRSSFFGYVSVGNDTTGGGTNFPLLDAPEEGGVGFSWCSFVDCDAPYEDGVTFRPIEGNAVYWENLNADGSGDERALHAGLPVTTGSKVGMNIWTRQGPLPDELLGESA
ncbi:2OG-Fe(II) oxygenase superfamily protein [Plectosphaerella cucumerina]|uniref:2OG-Fe(II) oxygenase superfamily protein n=1 Tax=Plectosphaerella cucumerina TaxID=40658 RepID=A0A8K0WYB3_9PEZI|nr:2OG-Fe(II) oxygenase superfamily protein [Plectosphaerella cucumerina]